MLPLLLDCCPSATEALAGQSVVCGPRIKAEPDATARRKPNV
jgi:hypothetical protein